MRASLVVRLVSCIAGASACEPSGELVSCIAGASAREPSGEVS